MRTERKYNFQVNLPANKCPLKGKMNDSSRADIVVLIVIRRTSLKWLGRVSRGNFGRRSFVAVRCRPSELLLIARCYVYYTYPPTPFDFKWRHRYIKSYP